MSFPPPSTIYEPYSKDYSYPSLRAPSTSSSLPLTYPLPALTSPAPLASPSAASPISRRRTDYIDQASQAYSGAPYPYHSTSGTGGGGRGVAQQAVRPSIDYPSLKMPGGIQQPPVAAAPTLERQLSRGTVVPVRRSSSISLLDGSGREDEKEVVYWGNEFVGMSGLKNLGKYVIPPPPRFSRK